MTLVMLKILGNNYEIEYVPEDRLPDSRLFYNVRKLLVSRDIKLDCALDEIYRLAVAEIIRKRYGSILDNLGAVNKETFSTVIRAISKDTFDVYNQIYN